MKNSEVGVPRSSKTMRYCRTSPVGVRWIASRLRLDRPIVRDGWPPRPHPPPQPLAAAPGSWCGEGMFRGSGRGELVFRGSRRRELMLGGSGRGKLMFRGSGCGEKCPWLRQSCRGGEHLHSCQGVEPCTRGSGVGGWDVEKRVWWGQGRGEKREGCAVGTRGTWFSCLCCS